MPGQTHHQHDRKSKVTKLEFNPEVKTSGQAEVHVQTSTKNLNIMVRL